MGGGIGRIALLVAAIMGAGVAAASLLPSRPGTRPALDLLSLAKIDYADRDFARAEERLRQVLSLKPNNAPARRLMGRVLLGRGRTAEARETFTALHREDAADYEAVRGLADVCEWTGEWDLACLYYERAVSLRKDDPEAWRALGAAQERKGDGWAASAAYRQSLGLDGSQSDLARGIGGLTLAPAPPPPTANRAFEPRVPQSPDPKRVPSPGRRGP